MKNIGFGQIILLIAFMLVPLIKFVIQRFRSSPGAQIPEADAVTQIRRQTQPVPAPAPSTRAAIDHGGSSRPSAVTRPSASRVAKGSLFRAKGDVQRGIIIMTVLGPCRAFNPLDNQRAQLA